MRGDLQCNTIFFQPKGWKTAVTFHRSHKTVFNRFMEDQYYSAGMVNCLGPPSMFPSASTQRKRKAVTSPEAGEA